MSPAPTEPRPPLLPGLVEAAQLEYLSASIIPILLGFAAALDRDDARWALAPIALLAGVAAHAGTNVINGTEDFRHGVDTAAMEGGNRAFVDGLLTWRQGRRAGLALFGLALVLGLVLVARTGPALLPIGIVGLVGGYTYTAGPWPYKYHALGEPLIIVLMGPLMSQGAFTALTGDGFDATAAGLGLVPGLLIAATLAGNNLADLEDDRQGGVLTLAGVLGFERARLFYVGILAAAYATVPVLVLLYVAAWPCLAALLTLPLALRPLRIVRTARSGDPRLAPTAPLTALAHLAAGVALVVGETAGRLADVA